MSHGARRRARNTNRGDHTTRAEINIVSLVDVAFTLLLIFIITAPALQGGVEVEVPQGEVTSIRAQDNPFFVSVERDGTIYIGETPVSREDFEEAFPQLVRVAQPPFIYVRADSLADYGVVFRVISAVAAAEGIPFGLVGEPLPRR